MREAAETERLTLGDLLFPLINLTATTLANAVVENKLDAAEEIENIQQMLEQLYEEYLVAYNQQTA